MAREVIRMRDMQFDPELFRNYMSGTVLDELLCSYKGLRKGANYMIIGDPGVGKTTIILDLLSNIRKCNPGARVLFISAEMNEIDLAIYVQRFPKFQDLDILFIEANFDVESDTHNLETVKGTLEQGWDIVAIDSFYELQGIIKDEENYTLKKAESVLLSLIKQQNKAANARSVNTTFLTIQQVTKAGHFIGSNRLKHSITAMLELRLENPKNIYSDRYAVFSKHRRGDVGVRLYYDLSVTGDYYTLGSWAIDLNSRYKVNYKFNGQIALTYSNDQAGEKGSADFVQSRNFGLRWSHTQDSKAHPGTTFSASVNFSSPSNSRYNARSVTDAQQNQISSSISYSHNWNGKFNLSVNALHNQNSRDSSYSFTLPNITFNVTRFYPFKRKTRVGKEQFYEKISFGYSTSFQNRINFKMRELQDFVMDETGNHVTIIDELNNKTYREKAFGDSLAIKALGKLTNGMTHNFQIGLPNFTLFKYINVTPSISYGMNWMFSKGEQHLENELDADGNPIMVTDKNGQEVIAQKLVSDPGTAFNGFGMTHTYSGSMSMSTRIYGMFNFGKHRRVQAIRHVITPSMSLSFSPEKGTAFNGWRTLDPYYDKRGTFHDVTWYNIYSISGNHNNASPPGRGKSATMSLSFGNNLEAKVRDVRDTTGTGSKKVKLLDQLNINTSYNFLADSLRMNNIGISASTRLFNKVSISGNLNFDPYAINEQGKKINKLNIVATGVPARLTNASLSASYAINGKGATDGDDGTRSGKGGGSGSGGSGATASYERIYYHPITGEYIPGGYVYYMNSNAPWSVNFSYSFNYSKSYTYQSTTKELIENKRFTQTLNVSGNIKLTPRLSIQATSGFDIMAMRFTTTQLSATYDLHCFNIALSWVPMGQWKSYSFRIAANASALADLLRFKKSDSYMDNMLK